MNGIVVFGPIAAGFAYLAWRFRTNALDKILFGATAFVLFVPSFMQIIYLYVSKSFGGYGILLSGAAGFLGYLIGIALAVRAVFISGEKFARWMAALGSLFLFAGPIGLGFLAMLLIGSGTH